MVAMCRRGVAGYGKWEDGSKERCKVYWRKPEEWADMIAQRVVDCGFQDQVFTIFDVLHGEFSADTGTPSNQALRTRLIQRSRPVPPVESVLFIC